MDNIFKQLNQRMRDKYKILHINTDGKFLHAITRYKDDEIQNDLLFIGDDKDDTRIKYTFSNNPSDLDKVVKLANTYDAVVLLELEHSKSYITNRLRKDIPIFWLFFGAELYSKLPNVMFSKMTKAALSRQNWKQGIKFKFWNLYQWVQKKRFPEFGRALKRINYFLCLCREEYDFLSNYFVLPEFMQRSYVFSLNEHLLECSRQKAGNKIMVGNSRSAFNNHLEVLELLKSFPDVEKYAFLSYGSEGSYYKTVLNKGKELKNFKPITDFLAKPAFEGIYKSLDAAVFNSYRQLAVGNILTAIRYGVKVYMNERNAYYQFLKNEGILVFNIKNLETDLKRHTITLSSKEFSHNINALNALSLKYSKAEFVNGLKNGINKSHSTNN